MKLGFDIGFDLVAILDNLLDTFGANRLTKEVVHMTLHVPAKVTARLILTEDDLVLIHKDFERIALDDPKAPAQLHRDYHTA